MRVKCVRQEPGRYVRSPNGEGWVAVGDVIEVEDGYAVHLIRRCGFEEVKAKPKPPPKTKAEK